MLLEWAPRELNEAAGASEGSQEIDPIGFVCILSDWLRMYSEGFEMNQGETLFIVPFPAGVCSFSIVNSFHFNKRTGWAGGIFSEEELLLCRARHGL